MMTLEIKGDWNVTLGKLKQKWAKLTDVADQFVLFALGKLKIRTLAVPVAIK